MIIGDFYNIIGCLNEIESGCFLKFWKSPTQGLGATLKSAENMFLLFWEVFATGQKHKLNWKGEEEVETGNRGALGMAIAPKVKN